MQPIIVIELRETIMLRTKMCAVFVLLALLLSSAAFWLSGIGGATASATHQRKSRNARAKAYVEPKPDDVRQVFITPYPAFLKGGMARNKTAQLYVVLEEASDSPRQIEIKYLRYTKNHEFIVTDTIDVPSGSCVGNKVIHKAVFAKPGYVIAQARVGGSRPGSATAYVAKDKADFKRVPRDLPVFFTPNDQNFDVRVDNVATVSYGTTTDADRSMHLHFVPNDGSGNKDGPEVTVKMYEYSGTGPIAKDRLNANIYYSVVTNDDEVIGTIWTAP